MNKKYNDLLANAFMTVFLVLSFYIGLILAIGLTVSLINGTLF